MPSGVPIPFRPDLGAAARAWPFEEARRLLARIEKRQAAGKKVEEVVFESGYGPSGLPHIGTFGEVARTTWVRNAFNSMSPIKTRLIAISDDMDGLRKVPDNLPHPEMLAANLGKPLTSVPDPFGTHESFGHHMNARLRAFLDKFEFDYDFRSATEMYRSGVYDAALLRVLAKYDEVMKVMLPTLGEERQQTYSPFLPLSPRSGKILLARVVSHDVAKGTNTISRKMAARKPSPSPAAIANCNGSRISACAGQRSASTTRCTARSTILPRHCTTRSAESPAAPRPSSSCTNCSSTRPARRSPSPRATA
jgi:hypothetical protein